MSAYQQTDIFDACRKGDVEAVRAIYESDNESINSVDMKGFTPLILAVYNEQPAIVDFLLEKGAQIDVADTAGNTALMGVCFKGYKEIATKLINAGADVNQRNVNGATALTFAATFGHLDIAKMLLEKGADIYVPDVRGKSPLEHARMQENWEMYELLGQYSDRFQQ
jgi:ankyrin repeat protein